MSSTENGSSEPNGNQEAEAADDAAAQAKESSGHTEDDSKAPAAETDAASDNPEGSAEETATDEESSSESDDDELTVDDILGAAAANGQASDDTLNVLQTTVEERTRDLQRLSAEFQNYRKRVERDKARAAEAQTIAVLSNLLPVLDDLDRAREHGDLTGPFSSVADQLYGALTKHGLESFGEKGDEFDPNLHEAVAHMHSDEVDGPTCIDVMRRGYRVGDKLVRAAMVAVAEPPEGGEAEGEPEDEKPDDSTEAEDSTDDSATDSDDKK